MACFSRFYLIGIIRVAVPLVLAMLASNIMSLVDLAMISRLGVAEVGVLGIGITFRFLLLSPFIGLSMATQTLVAGKTGQGDLGDIWPIFRLSLTVTLLLSLLILAILLPNHLLVLDFLVQDRKIVDIGADYFRWLIGLIPLMAFHFLFRGFWVGAHKTKIYFYTNILADSVISF